MTVVLDKDVEEFVGKQSSLTGGSPDTFVNDALRYVSEQQRAKDSWPEGIEEWLLEAVDSPAAPLTSADYDAMRALTIQKLASTAA